ncbi:alpha/beta fold hydrolase [Comamonas composti]|uniref:alpha/beta fold hydrolase n=1 Tax=Comamonas composti TaxID=408558 RepID=UPI00041B0B82|nr:alpha/beta hydrolase [Comamonas composti]
MQMIEDLTGTEGVAAKISPEDHVFHTYPGARPPDRQGVVHAHGIQLATYEWGPLDAPPVLLVHGALDFARTFDVFAPKIADAGYRVVSYDQRGHGNSEHAALYGWVADERDLLCVADAISPHPIAAIGHSKGGSLLMHAIEAFPHRFTRFACIDGMPFRRARPPEDEYRYLSQKAIAGWLSHRHTAAHASRKAAPLQDLARRRARLNPRLTHEWLCYLVTQGARHDSAGWRWRLDPEIRPGSFGPMRSRWQIERLPGFPIPLLALFSTVKEPMGWECQLKDIAPFLPAGASALELEDTGHFIHIERPQRTAQLILEFLKP